MATRVEAAPVLKVRFWWADWHPEAMFDPVSAFALPEPEQWEIFTAKDSVWRLPRPGATLAQLREYMEARGLAVKKQECGRTRRRGGWEGLFELSIGPI